MTGVLFLSSFTKEIIEDSRVKVITGDIQYPSTELMECTATVEAKSDNIVLQRGICYGSRPMPCLEYAEKYSHFEGYTNFEEGHILGTSNGGGAGTFTAVLKDIPANSTIHYRAYAKTKKGVVYGEDKEYSISGNPDGILSINSSKWTNTNQVDVSGFYHRDYSWQTAYSDQRGFIYSEDPDLNTYERLVVGWFYESSSYSQSFNGTITGLDPSKVYYVKSFVLVGGMTLYSSYKELRFGN